MAGTKGKSGGKRKRSGRKKLPDSEKVKKVNIQVTEKLKSILDELDGKNYDERIYNFKEETKWKKK